jgi:DNA repair protein RadC
MIKFAFPKVVLNVVRKIELKVVLNGYVPTHQIRTSQDLYHYALSVIDKNTLALNENFYVIFLNRSNHVSGYFHASMGGITGTVVDVRNIMQAALLHNSTVMILLHNHPSGNLTPSQADLDITRKVKEAGKLFDIQVVDHLIITPYETYYSFADNGVL